MKKILALLAMLLLLTACGQYDDTLYMDESKDAFALVSTSSGNTYLFNAYTYCDEQYTAQADALAYPYSVYLESADTATIRFTCAACHHKEMIYNITAPSEFYLECDCITGDRHPDHTEVLLINFILGSPPAEEG